MNAPRTLKAGDVVFHRPTGEKWLLIENERDGHVIPGGWPRTRARASDCDLVEAIENAPERARRIFQPNIKMSHEPDAKSE